MTSISNSVHTSFSKCMQAQDPSPLQDMDPKKLANNEELVCNICLETIDKNCSTPLQYHVSKNKEENSEIRHIFHKECIQPWLKIKKECPTCRSPLKKNLSVDELPTNSDKIDRVSKHKIKGKNWTFITNLNLEDFSEKEIKKMVKDLVKDSEKEFFRAKRLMSYNAARIHSFTPFVFNSFFDPFFLEPDEFFPFHQFRLLDW